MGELELGVETIRLLNQQQAEILQYRFIIDEVRARIFWKDKEGRFLGANAMCLKDMGVTSRDAVLGKTDYDLFPKEQADAFRKDDIYVMDYGPKLGIEEPQEQEDGTHWLVTHKVPLKDHLGSVVGILGVYVDITDRKKLESEIVHNSKMAAVGQLIAGISHELNNPFAALMLHVEHLLSAPRFHDDVQLIKTLMHMQNAIKRGFAIVNSMNDFSRKEPLVKKILSVERIFKHVATLSDPMAIQYETDLLFDRGTTSLRFMGCISELETVLLNVIVNSLQSLDPRRANNSVVIRAIDRVRSGKYGVQISVVDTGCGIKESDMDQVFDPFFTTKDPGKGTGLGLSLARKVIDDHGGEIQIQSTYGVGTTVSIWLPGIK